MKKIVFLCIFSITGLLAYSQTWATYVDEHWDMEFNVITKEQFDRIVNAQETTANFVILDFFDTIQTTHDRITRGTRPNFNGYYYLMIRFIPKTAAARNQPENISAWVRYGNSRTGFMNLTFLTSMETGAISLRFNRNEYIRQKNQLIRLVNGE